MSDQRKLYCVPCEIEWEMVVIANDAEEARKIAKRHVREDLDDIGYEANTSTAREIMNESEIPEDWDNSCAYQHGIGRGITPIQFFKEKGGE